MRCAHIEVHASEFEVLFDPAALHVQVRAMSNEIEEKTSGRMSS